MTISIIGIDCAVQSNNVGLARSIFVDGRLKIIDVVIGSKSVSIAETIIDWISESQNVLIALDAPLGWPRDLGNQLCAHMAGCPIDGEPNRLFRRVTDRFVKHRIGKQPLDVGADRIARTAYAALLLLDEIRAKTGVAIPLTWNPGTLYGKAAIEVYPAATLIAHAIHVTGYKRKDGQEARKILLNELEPHLHMPSERSLMEKDDDALDAVICCLAGADFLRGEVMAPIELDVAKKEGWIWVRYPDQ